MPCAGVAGAAGAACVRSRRSIRTPRVRARAPHPAARGLQEGDGGVHGRRLSSLVAAQHGAPLDVWRREGSWVGGGAAISTPRPTGGCERVLMGPRRMAAVGAGVRTDDAPLFVRQLLPGPHRQGKVRLHACVRGQQRVWVPGAYCMCAHAPRARARARVACVRACVHATRARVPRPGRCSTTVCWNTHWPGRCKGTCRSRARRQTPPGCSRPLGPAQASGRTCPGC